MASFVNAADAVAAAVEIERRGYQFYMGLSEQVTAKPDKDFFAHLAAEELKHEKVFSKILDRLGGLELPAGSSDEEYLAYVRDLLDSHSLFTEDQTERAKMSPLSQAITLEKDTLLFFMELETMVPESERKYVRDCADEERKHLRKLADYMRLS